MDQELVSSIKKSAIVASRSLSILAAVAALVVACSTREPAKGPSVLVVSIDSLRADHLGAYGYGRPTSPFLDSLAANGVRFAEFQSLSPWTLPSHTTMFSGRHELDHGVVEMDRAIGADVRLLAEHFHERGYRTAGVVTGFFVSRKFGFARGFDSFHDFDVQQGEDWRGVKTAGAEAVDRVLEWIGRGSDRPFFVFLHLFDVHWPYDPPAPERELFPAPPESDPGRYRGFFHYPANPLTPAEIDHVVARYDGSIRYADGQLARLDHALRERGHDFVTLVTADHGEEFFEHGSWGHAHTLYREQLWIPWIVHGPGVPRGKVVSAAADMLDFAPTVLDLAGLPPDPAHQGRSRRPQWEGREPAPAPARPSVAMTSRLYSLGLALDDGREKLVLDFVRKKTELYDRAADPGETRDLAPTAASRVADREAALRQEVAERLRTTAHLEWRALAPATLRLDSDGAFVWLDGAPLPPGFPLALTVPVAGDGKLAFRVFPNDARLHLRVEGATAPIVSATGAPIALPKDGLPLSDPSLAGAASATVPPGALRIAVEREVAPTEAVSISESQREALRSLGYASPP